jgi:predicted AAA+ superfamily ATPase
MRVFFELLRGRVGSPLSLASLARDLAVSPTTLRRYLDILQALYVVIVVQPWHRNIARALLQAPKVYFTDTGLVKGNEGLRFENAVAVMLAKQAHFISDTRGREADLHYIRTKDGAEVDFCLSVDGALTQLVECKLADSSPHRALLRFAAQFPEAEAFQIVRDARQEEVRGPPPPPHPGSLSARAGRPCPEHGAQGRRRNPQGRRNRRQAHHPPR